MSWTEANEREVQRRVALIRNCLHVKFHRYDENGNRRCVQCDGMVRDTPGVPLLEVETRTLTDGFVVTGAWHFIRKQEQQLRADLGLPPLPEPVVLDQQRWTSAWVPA